MNGNDYDSSRQNVEYLIVIYSYQCSRYSSICALCSEHPQTFDWNCNCVSDHFCCNYFFITPNSVEQRARSVHCFSHAHCGFMWSHGLCWVGGLRVCTMYVGCVQQNTGKCDVHTRVYSWLLLITNIIQTIHRVIKECDLSIAWKFVCQVCVKLVLENLLKLQQQISTSICISYADSINCKYLNLCACVRLLLLTLN